MLHGLGIETHLNKEVSDIAPFGSRRKRRWNAFEEEHQRPYRVTIDTGPGYSYKPDRSFYSGGAERTIIGSIKNRIALDCSAVEIRHVRLDENGRYKEDMDSELNQCLTVSANLDQTPRAFLHDAVLSLLDEGVVALVATETDDEPEHEGAFDILSMRVGKVVEWFPHKVRVRVYNEDTGQYEDVLLNKATTPIIESPFYSVMNAPNSTFKRLVRKLNILDVIDEQSASGKLDLLIQLPYSTRNEITRERAKNHLKDIEEQLIGSKYGIGYVDSAERIIQLNRPVENNLMHQVEYLTSMLYSQLGITLEIMNGTADEQAMLNYNSRIIEPIVSAICDSMDRCYISKTARTRGQSIMFFKDPFKLVPVNNIAEIADKFTRNEIMTSNEIRQVIGMKPSDDPSADELRNKNLSQSKEQLKSSPEIQNENEDEDKRDSKKSKKKEE